MRVKGEGQSLLTQFATNLWLKLRPTHVQKYFILLQIFKSSNLLFYFEITKYFKFMKKLSSSSCAATGTGTCKKLWRGWVTVSPCWPCCEIRSYNNVRIGGEGGWVAVSKSNQNQSYQTRSAPRHTIICGEVGWQFLGHLWLEKTTPTACTGAVVWKRAGNYISLAKH